MNSKHTLLSAGLISVAFFGAQFGDASQAVAVEPPITSLAFAPEGKSLLAVSQSGLHQFSWPKLENLRTIKVSAANLHCLAFSPNGKQLVVGGGNPAENGSLEIFSWPTGRSIHTLEGHMDSIRSVVWVSNSQLLTASIDREIRSWDLDPTKKEATVVLKGHSRRVDAICLIENATTLVSAGEDQSVRVWNLETGTIIRNLNQHTQPIHALAVRPSADGLPMVASAAADRTIRLWQPTIGRMVRYVRLDAEPLNITWLNDGSHIAAACVDGRLRIVDADEVRVTHDLPAIQGWLYALAAHPTDGSVAVGGTGAQIRRIEPTFPAK